MTRRDPRIDPAPGDSISRQIKTALQGVIIRDVTRAHGGFVFFLQDNGYQVKPRCVCIANWRKWAAKSEVNEVSK